MIHPFTMAVDGRLQHFCFSLVADSFVYAGMCKHDWKDLDLRVFLRNGSIKGEGCLEDSPKSMRAAWWVFVRLYTWPVETACFIIKQIEGGQIGAETLILGFKAWIACLRITQIKRVTCLQKLCPLHAGHHQEVKKYIFSVFRRFW